MLLPGTGAPVRTKRTSVHLLVPRVVGEDAKHDLKRGAGRRLAALRAAVRIHFLQAEDGVGVAATHWAESGGHGRGRTPHGSATNASDECGSATSAFNEA